MQVSNGEGWGLRPSGAPLPHPKASSSCCQTFDCSRATRHLNFNVKSPDVGKTGGVKHIHEQDTAPRPLLATLSPWGCGHHLPREKTVKEKPDVPASCVVRSGAQTPAAPPVPDPGLPCFSK